MLSNFKFYILIIFVFLDVFSFNTSIDIQLPISIIIYLFLTVAFIKNNEVGVLYFISFNILCIGLGNYNQSEVNQYNYWGLRVLGLSVNTYFILLFFTAVLVKNKFQIKSLFRNDLNVFFAANFIQGILIGLLLLIFGKTFSDNLAEDTLKFLPSILYIFILLPVSSQNFKKIFVYVIPATLIQMYFSLFLDKRFIYGFDEFLLTNSLYIIFPFALLISKRLYNKYIWILMTVLLAILLVGQFYFISGKTIIIIIILLIWYSTRNFKRLILLLLPLVLLVINLKNILLLGSEMFIDLPAISFKFGQIAEAIEYIESPFQYAALPTSLSNLLAEFLTLIRYSYENMIGLIFGNGFGATVPDYWGFLEQFIGESGGYRVIDAERQAYFQLHLPVYDILLKGGIFIFYLYANLLYRSLKMKENGILLFILLFTIFSLSKETLILLFVFYYAAIEINNELEEKLLQN